jgi:hypothetical protein
VDCLIEVDPTPTGGVGKNTEGAGYREAEGLGKGSPLALVNQEQICTSPKGKTDRCGLSAVEYGQWENRLRRGGQDMPPTGWRSDERTQPGRCPALQALLRDLGGNRYRPKPPGQDVDAVD